MIDGRQRIYADHRMYRWQSQGNVAHIRGTTGPCFPFAKIAKRSPERLGIPAVELRYSVIVVHFGIGPIASNQLQCRACGESTGLEATMNTESKFGQLIYRLRANHVFGRGEGGDYVRSRPAIGHNTMYAIRRTDMLTQQSKGCLSDRERIGRVHPEFREGRGVGCLPVKCMSNMDAAMIFARSMSKGAGCTIMAA